MDSATVCKILNLKEARDNLAAYKYFDGAHGRLALNLTILVETLRLSQALFVDCQYYAKIRTHLNQVVAVMESSSQLAELTIVPTDTLDAELAQLSIQEQMVIESGVCLLITRLRTLLDLKGSEFFFDEMRRTF